MVRLGHSLNGLAAKKKHSNTNDSRLRKGAEVWTGKQQDLTFDSFLLPALLLLFLPMGLIDTLSHLSSGSNLNEAQALLERLEASPLTEEQRAWVGRLRELLEDLDRNNSLGLFF